MTKGPYPTYCSNSTNGQKSLGGARCLLCCAGHTKRTAYGKTLPASEKMEY